MRSTRAVVLAAAVVAVVAGFQGLATADDEPVVTEPPVTEPTVTEPPPEPVVTEPPAPEPTTTEAPSTAPEPAAPVVPSTAPSVAARAPSAAPAPSTSPAPAPTAPAASPLPTARAQVFFSSCEEASRAGYWNMRRGEPGYSANLDRDGDGIACDDPSNQPTQGTAPAVTTPTPAPQVAGASQTQPYANCTEARADGQTNIPASSPVFQPGLDADNDGIGCEQGESGTATTSGVAGAGSLAQTGTDSIPLSVTAGALVLLGLLAFLVRERLNAVRYIVVHSKTGAIHLVPRARRFQ
ncbi:excalibur calcium-binding domain-containing protein [Dermatobacter hominis]|uniref:excalibur calcium-binding domain-containing protein n=1 Tax=Dermatobacter hominis TaxID=2884263 RepID=UPI001D1139B5|nr:excalibur calcium-binding domain-containing protein [Dermatobacter hominis]UDY34302.1 excalibur calcium-binding domain-containing protein [Dermatobacter hominis]